MDAPEPCYVEFGVADSTRFEALQRAFEALKEEKRVKGQDEFRAEEEWLQLFDEEALAQFWWPSDEEFKAHMDRWWSAPVADRWHDKSLQAPSWLFGSMIGAFQHGEYDLIGCRMVGPGTARMEFWPWAAPFGGTGSMQMLAKAFGFQVVAVDDGVGRRLVP